MPIRLRPRARSPPAPKAGVAFLADDDVVVHRNAERFGDFHDLLGHLDVGARRRRVA
jgi:hypothetical protein